MVIDRFNECSNEPYISRVHSKQNKNTLRTLVQLPELKKNNPYCQVMGSVWVLFIFSAHTTPIYLTYFAGNPYTAYVTVIITSI